MGAYDILKVVRASNGVTIRFASACKSMRVQGNKIDTMRDADTDVFSASDLECLNEAIKIAAPLSFEQLKSLSHDDAYKATRAYGTMDIAAIAALGENATALIQHLSDPHPDRE